MAKKKSVKSGIKPTFKLYYESDKASVNRLIEVYKEDKLKARVLYHQNKGAYNYTRTVKYERHNGDFEVVSYLVKYGISTSSIMYKRESKFSSIIYKNGKFWYATKRVSKRMNTKDGFSQLTFFTLRNFIQGSSYKESEIYKDLLNKFGWIRNIQENDNFHSISFNTIVTNKLFGSNDLLRHLFKCPLPIAKILIENPINGHPLPEFLKVWKEMKKVLINIENLSVDTYNSHYFNDTCKMAATLGKKVNCAWSVKRLKAEHDEWSKQISEVLMSLEPLVELKVDKLYLDFAEFSGYNVFKTNRELLIEGKVMKHCVGTYINAVDSGRSGIYHVKGYTLELHITTGQILAHSILGSTKTSNVVNKTLSIAQFRGYQNKDAPAELIKEVKDKLDEFNKKNMIVTENVLAPDDVYQKAWFLPVVEREYNANGEEILNG